MRVIQLSCMLLVSISIHCDTYLTVKVMLSIVMCDIVFLYCILRLLHANLSRLRLLSRFTIINTKQHLYKVQNTNQCKLIKHHEEVKWVSTVMATHLHVKTLTYPHVRVKGDSVLKSGYCQLLKKSPRILH